jgi:hypothetical protein
MFKRGFHLRRRLTVIIAQPHLSLIQTQASELKTLIACLLDFNFRRNSFFLVAILYKRSAFFSL